MLCSHGVDCISVIEEYASQHGCSTRTASMALRSLHYILTNNVRMLISLLEAGDIAVSNIVLSRIWADCGADKILEHIDKDIASEIPVENTIYSCELQINCVVSSCVVVWRCLFSLSPRVMGHVMRAWKMKKKSLVVASASGIERAEVMNFGDAVRTLMEILEFARCRKTYIRVDGDVYLGTERLDIWYNADVKEGYVTFSKVQAFSSECDVTVEYGSANNMASISVLTGKGKNQFILARRSSVTARLIENYTRELQCILL